METKSKSFVADFHVHSCFSRATSKQCNLEMFNYWSQLKGIRLVGTGDFTHPAWYQEITTKLEPSYPGLFQLKKEYKSDAVAKEFPACRGKVDFILTAEISCIYKRDGKVRKVHNLLVVPDFKAVDYIRFHLDRIGNIKSDGRPILGLDSQDLLTIVLDSSPQSYLVPAHIWTPWFSALGSKSGFDSIQECYGDLSQHIFAVETGLSSDPAMNWRLSSLDPYTLISNSDAHSPENLGREANLFCCPLSFNAVRAALAKENRHFMGTIEFFPQEGKYHLDGHRKCHARLQPADTQKNDGRCPVCGRPVTVGVLHRVEELADRQPDHKPPDARPFQTLVALKGVLSEILGKGPKTKTVNKSYTQLIYNLGPELNILRETALNDLKHSGGTLLAQGIERIRKAKIKALGGYDGEYGIIKVFEPEELERAGGQRTLFSANTVKKKTETTYRHIKTPNAEIQKADKPNSKPLKKEGEISNSPPGIELNTLQQTAVEHQGEHLLIKAGPGTGKTRTLTCRIAHLLENKRAFGDEIAALTFTNKAASEMEQRLNDLLGEKMVSAIFSGTFHTFAIKFLKQTRPGYQPLEFTLLNRDDQREILSPLLPKAKKSKVNNYLSQISLAKGKLIMPGLPGKNQTGDTELHHLALTYTEYCRAHNILDFDDLLIRTLQAAQYLATKREVDWDKIPSIANFLSHYQPWPGMVDNGGNLQPHFHPFKWIFVDEYQDINYLQHQLLLTFVQPGINLCAIGDPDQAIYGFRGAEPSYFNTFAKDFIGADIHFLQANYRSTKTILNASGQGKNIFNQRQKTVVVWSGEK